MDSLTLKIEVTCIDKFLFIDQFNLFFFTLGDQMHEDNGQAAPCERLWFWNPYRRGLVNVQILAMLSDYKARHHLIHDLTSLLKIIKIDS
jgi:hypothetical protein